MKFKSELIKTVCLLQEEGFEISFIHKSVAQYYAAAFISRSSDAFAFKFYELASKKRGWELELKFLSELDSYRYMKMYELGLLIKARADFGIEDFDENNIDQIRLINTSFQKQTEFVTKRPSENSSQDGRRLTGWRFSSWDMNTASTYIAEWTHRLWSIIYPLPKTLRLEKAVGQREIIPAEKYADEIRANEVTLAKPVLRSLRLRAESAAKVINAEEDKTAYLAAFVDLPSH